MRQFSFAQVWRAVSKHKTEGRKKKKKKGISGRTNIWEMTAYRREKPEGGTANASQRHWQDSSCGRRNNSSLQTGWQDDCTTAAGRRLNAALTCRGVTLCKEHPAAQTQRLLQPTHQISPVRPYKPTTAGHWMTCKAKQKERLFENWCVTATFRQCNREGLPAQTREAWLLLASAATI